MGRNVTLAGVCAVECGSRSLIGMVGDSGALTGQREEHDKRARAAVVAPRPQRARALNCEGLCYRLRPRIDANGEGLGFTRL